MELPPANAVKLLSHINQAIDSEKMNEWKNIHCTLYKADTPRMRNTTQNICFLISISAITDFEANSQNYINFRLVQVLQNSMAWHFLTFRSLSSKLEFVYPPWSRVEEQMLIFLSIHSPS